MRTSSKRTSNIEITFIQKRKIIAKLPILGNYQLNE